MTKIEKQNSLNSMIKDFIYNNTGVKVNILRVTEKLYYETKTTFRKNLFNKNKTKINLNDFIFYKILSVKYIFWQTSNEIVE